MTHYHTSLTCACSIKDCGVTAVFTNPEGHGDWSMVAKAIKSDRLQLGWYICEFGGRDLCPNHHQLAADKLGWTSLYAGPPTKTIPITTIEASKRNREAA